MARKMIGRLNELVALGVLVGLKNAKLGGMLPLNLSKLIHTMAALDTDLDDQLL